MVRHLLDTYSMNTNQKTNTRLRTKFTYFQEKYAIQLAILKHFYLNHF